MEGTSDRGAGCLNREGSRSALRAAGVATVRALRLDAPVGLLDHDLRVPELPAGRGRRLDGLRLPVEAMLLAAALHDPAARPLVGCHVDARALRHLATSSIGVVGMTVPDRPPSLTRVIAASP